MQRALNDADPVYAAAALTFVRALPGEAITNGFAALLASLDNTQKIGMIAALEDRGDPAAGKAILAEAGPDSDDAVRQAALLALGRLGDEAAAMALLKVASHEKGMAPRYARESLARLPGKGINALLMNVVKGDDAAMQVQAGPRAGNAPRERSAALARRICPLERRSGAGGMPQILARSW